MMIIALMLALVGTPTMTWTRMNMLLIMITSFIHETYEDMPCMHRILHVGKNSEDYTFIMSH